MTRREATADSRPTRQPAQRRRLTKAGVRLARGHCSGDELGGLGVVQLRSGLVALLSSFCSEAGRYGCCIPGVDDGVAASPTSTGGLCNGTRGREDGVTRRRDRRRAAPSASLLSGGDSLRSECTLLAAAALAVNSAALASCITAFFSSRRSRAAAARRVSLAARRVALAAVKGPTTAWLRDPAAPREGGEEVGWGGFAVGRAARSGAPGGRPNLWRGGTTQSPCKLTWTRTRGPNKHANAVVRVQPKVCEHRADIKLSWHHDARSAKGHHEIAGVGLGQPRD